MNFSKLEKDVLSWLYEKEEDPVIKSQIEAAKPIKRKYTSVGVWVHIDLPGNVEAVPDEYGDITAIPGPRINSSNLKCGAESAIYITNGFLDTLEIFSVKDNFPEKLDHYELVGP